MFYYLHYYLVYLFKPYCYDTILLCNDKCLAYLCRLFDWFHICKDLRKVNKYEWMKHTHTHTHTHVLCSWVLFLSRISNRKTKELTPNRTKGHLNVGPQVCTDWHDSLGSYWKKTILFTSKKKKIRRSYSRRKEERNKTESVRERGDKR